MKIFDTFSTILQEHASYAQQIKKLAKADLIRTYRGATLGWLWALIKPSFTIFIYWFVFAVGLRGSRDVAGFPFFFWLIAGMIPWFYMSDMLALGTRSIKKYSYLVTKMKFPISTIPTFVSLSNFIVHLALCLVMIGLFWLGGYPPDVYLLQLPFYLLGLFLFFTFLSLSTALLSAVSQDVSNLIRSLVIAIFWLSGVIWDISGVSGKLGLLFRINPVTYLSYGYRNIFIYKRWFFEQPFELAVFLLWIVGLALLGTVFYHKLRKEIPDIL